MRDSSETQVELFGSNGVDGETGRPLLAPLSARELFGHLRGLPADPAEARQIERCRRRQEMAGKQQLAPADGVDVADLASAGWAVVFPRASDAADRRRLTAIREALAPLLELRRQQASRRDERLFRLLADGEQEAGLQASEDLFSFLDRCGAATSGPAVPAKFPYYVLLVGSPSEIPFAFQYQLDIEYAVGRLHFDTAQEYAEYARHVVANERPRSSSAAATTGASRAVFFAARNPGDLATAQMAAHLVQPLSSLVASVPGWQVETRLGDTAYKIDLDRLLHAETPPALLFMACHGMKFSSGHRRQLAHQGALVCQDWAGAAAAAISSDQYFAAEDVASDARLDGMIVCQFACYGGGTPLHDSFARASGARATRIAPYPFVARLPQRLLARGAVAVVAHVDRAWCWSFASAFGKRELSAFEDTLKRLAGGLPVGYAMERINHRYSELAAAVDYLEEQLDDDRILPAERFTGCWTAMQDARNYVVFGDPAVRLAARR